MQGEKFGSMSIVGVEPYLSDDVLKAIGETRNPEGHYAQRVKFSMAGKRARTASSKNLALAESMEEDGAGREEIRKETGSIIYSQ